MLVAGAPLGLARQRWYRDLLRESMEAEGFVVNEAEFLGGPPWSHSARRPRAIELIPRDFWSELRLSGYLVGKDLDHTEGCRVAKPYPPSRPYYGHADHGAQVHPRRSRPVP